MRFQLSALAVLIGLLGVACNGDDAELTTDSTIITGATDTQPATDDTTTGTSGSDGDGAASSPSTTLVGQAVTEYEVVHEIPNENGVAWHIVIPNGAYTDVDLQNFVFDLLESNPDLYGIEVFDDEAAAEAFLTPEEERSEEETQLLDRHHFVSVTGRARIDYRGPFSEFPGGVIGS